MKFLKRFSTFLLSATAAHAYTSFAGTNLYYAAGLSASQRATYLDALQAAGMKVIRVWLDGQSGTPKGTTITAFPDLEPTTIGTYDPTVLNLLDAFMVDANARGIKLLISMHSFNALQAGDVYGAEYGTGYFYEETQPQEQFDNRLKYVISHVHTTLGKPWSELTDYIIGFEAENEAMIGKGQAYIEDHTAWQCDRAQTIKTALNGNTGILVFTGGESWMDESVQSAWLSCEYIDVISIHAYGTGDFATSSITTYANEISSAGKLMIFEEWGACYYDTSNNDCDTGDVLSTSTRNSNIQAWASQITAAGVPWLYWQVIPNADPHYDTDFEIGITGDASWATLQAAAEAALTATAKFNFNPYLL